MTKANSGRFSLSANQTTSFFLVSGLAPALFGKAICGDQAAVLRLEPSPPMRRQRVPDVGDREAVSAWRRGHTPGLHSKLALTARVAHDRGRIVRENARHRRQVADVAVHDAKERADRFLVGGDAVQVTHLSKAAATD